MINILDKIRAIEKKVNNEILLISDLSKYIYKNNITKIHLNSFLENLIKILLNEERTIIVPTFTTSLLPNKVINLDTSKSNTGILSEIFRTYPNVERTPNPYFSYCVIGKYQKEFLKTDTLFEWSSSSHLGWMEQKNVSCIILGSYPENNPLLHRIEYKNKHLIKYRKIKKFVNTIIYKNKKIEHTQYYFAMKDNFKRLEVKSLFKKNKTEGIDEVLRDHLQIFHYKAETICKMYDNEIKNNPIFRNGIKL